MDDKKYRANRRILVIDGEVVRDETAMWFAQTTLSTLESQIAKCKMEETRNIVKDCSNPRHLLGIFRFKLVNFKHKLFKFIFKHFFLSNKAPSPDHIVCLYIKYDVDVTTETIVFGGAETHTQKLIQETLNRFFSNV